MTPYLRPEGAIPRRRREKTASEGRGETFQPRFLSQHEKESAVDGRKKEWQRGDFDFPPLHSPLKRPRRGLMPPSWIFPRSLVCTKENSKSTKRDNDAYSVVRRGSRNTLRLFRLPYVKYSTGANGTIRMIHRAMRKPDLTVARRAFFDGRGNENTHNKTTRFFARKRYRTRPAPLFCILFSGKTEKSMPAERQLRCLRKNGTSGESGDKCPARCACR